VLQRPVSAQREEKNKGGIESRELRGRDKNKRKRASGGGQDMKWSNRDGWKSSTQKRRRAGTELVEKVNYVVEKEWAYALGL